VRMARSGSLDAASTSRMGGAVCGNPLRRAASAPQAIAGALGARLAPEECGQGIPSVCFAWVNAEIGQQCLSFASGQARETTRVESRLKSAE